MSVPNPSQRIAELEAALARRILVLDGAMGTALQAVELTADDFGGVTAEGCPEVLVRTRPDVVLSVHRSYLEAGADIVETDTFGGTPIVLAEYGLQEEARALNRRAAELACQAAAEFATPGRPRFVAGSMGPTTKAISVTGGITFDALVDAFAVQARGLVEGGVDMLLLETQQDTRNVKAGLLAIERVFAELGVRIPVMVSGTIEPTGTMLAGQTAEALCASVQHADLLSIGLNCATGPEFMTDSIRSLAELAPTRISCVPNAGLPDEDGNYRETPEHMAEVLERFADRGWLNFVGGCCGTTPAHVRAFASMVEGKRPRTPQPHARSLYAGIELVEANDDNRPLLVGERTNVIGSRKFRRLIQEDKYEEASEIARLQVKNGAQILDVCLADPDRDELVDMERFLAQVIHKVKAPLMIDSTDPAVIERALTWCQGKSIINSINLEDGEERFAAVVPLARRYGAALVVGTIDEDPQQGMAVTRERKLEIAARSYELLVKKYGVPPQDIVWDPLTFPCATGDANYLGSAVETIEGIRLIKEKYPVTKTILGISNVSFGLPPAGREVLNAVFLYHCTKAGLDLAIVNAERLERYASIPDAERTLAEDLLYDRGTDPVAAFAAHFRGATTRSHKPASELTLDERLSQYIIEGTKEGLVEDIERKRAEAEPLDIINGPLMAGMAEVGRLFNDNQLIVAEVLQSAEAMKAAVAHLEQYMERASDSGRGKVVLATVKGDVHDIGKNLVDIILTNNGFTVVNLGIKVPPEALVQAVAEHRPDFLGLSGLLVKSAQQMVVTGGDLKEAGIQLPLLVGGAALSPGFARQRIAPAYGAPTLYARDAMDGLHLLTRIVAEGAETVAAEQAERQARAAPRSAPAALPDEGTTRSRAVRTDVPLPEVPDLARHAGEVHDLDEIWRLINPQMLYGRHLGFRGNTWRALESGDPKMRKLVEQVDAVKDECRAGAMRIRWVWQWFAVEAAGNEIFFFPISGDSPVPMRFPRQRKAEGLCLADYVLPPAAGRRDHVALFVTTAGEGIAERAKHAKDQGEYVRSHVLQALALESAEAAAEWLHRDLRRRWGFEDPDDLDPKDLFAARYRGKRYSFGYPACPDLAGQETLFALLRPQDIGVTLTEGHMMDPEASVSALVFHHPDAMYYSVGKEASEEVVT
jgi:5-methyltetrahydrofolate--homocysteine methyltransferase